MLVTQNRAAIARALRRGLAGFAAQEPISLREWAESHFYLSAESSYVEQRWEAWPFQRGILACIGSDDVHEVDVIKSARVGYTKILLAAVGYFAEHRRRNQVLWQPTDSARDEFVKTELDTMIRDVSVLHPIFPMREARHKDNTLLVKKFIGSMLHLRGGKSADNYRRLSVSVGYLDEFSSFDSNIDGEGDPGKLALKRLEGATFPKLVVGSTPKIKGLCLMEKRAEGADARYTYHIPCAHCDELHDLEWGGQGEPHGFKWVNDDPETVRHLCPNCGALATQGEYLAAAERGIWVGNDGTTIDQDGVFRDSEGNLIQPHLRVAFHVWTAYSPLVSWPKIVKEFMEAHKKASTGEDEELRTFWNTTLGRTWEGEIERMESDELQRRAEVEGYRSPGLDDGLVPKRCMLLLAGADIQGNRIEVGVWGVGKGGEMWVVDHQILFGNPSEDEVWTKLDELLFERRYLHEGGQQMPIYATAIDTGGHHSHAVYEYARKNRARRVYAIRGRPTGEKHIKDGVTQVDIDWRGKRVKKGVRLWYVGTNMAKDLLFGRLKVEEPGRGYVHLAADMSEEWFRQFAAEVRAVRRTAFGSRSVWTPIRKRNEVLDCCVYALWLEAHLELARKTDRWWANFAEKLGVDEPGDDPGTTETPQETPATAGVSVSKPRTQPATGVRRAAVRTGSSSYLRSRR
ncbi:phage terminase large subunit family protein [Alcaligenes faecalis]|uniref:phage terminase large subunit family protein n=1 Tax=Alcaligenes faecalis TaxID=511 RepID=UPI0018D184D7|nr:terminase gpA endonuclease subunit [Alcaligenes faecalis]MBH0311324.1 phage terminase large subunit family protein [Alcaligenes faecalis]